MKRTALSVMAILIALVPAAGSAGTPFLPGREDSGGYAAHIAAVGEVPGESDYRHDPLSPARAGAMSFLLPGLAQQRMGMSSRAYVFYALEAAGWITIGASLYQASSRRDAYEEYAVAFAGVDGTGYDEGYYEKVGRYISNDGPGGWNEYVRREARDLYYPDLAAMESYYEQNALTGEMGWRWNSLDARGRFNDLRSGSDSAERNALYAGFFLLGLRVVSAVDAVRLSRSEPDDGVAAGGEPLRLEAGPLPGGFYLSLNRPF